MQQKNPSLFILMVVVSFASVCASLITPAIPKISTTFQVSMGAAQWTITLYLLGYAVGELFYGPIANRWGRKAGLYAGCLIQILGCILCLIAITWLSFALLLIGRLTMALGACGGMVIAYTIVSDTHNLEQARKTMSYLVLAFAVLTGIAISVGGMLTTYLTWQACFYFLIIYGIFTLILCCFLPETCPPQHRKSITFQAITTAYQKIFSTPIFWIFSMLIGCTATYIYIFAASAPILAIHEMGLSAAQFGYYNYIVTGGYFLGNAINLSLGKKMRSHSLIWFGIGCTLIGSLWLLFNFIANDLSKFSLFAIGCIIYLGLPFVLANSTALLTHALPDKANTSGAMSFINMLFACLGVATVSLFHTHLTAAMAGAFIALTVLMILLSSYLLSLSCLRRVCS